MLDLSEFTDRRVMYFSSGARTFRYRPPKSLQAGDFVVLKLSSDRSDKGKAKIQVSAARQHAARVAVGQGIAPVYSWGEIDGAGGFITAYYRNSVESLTFKADAPAIFTFSGKILGILEKLRRRSGAQHGNLKSTNIYCIEADGHLVDFEIGDFSPRPDIAPEEDLQALGRILLWLIHNRQIPPSEDVPLFGTIAFWRRFGWDAPKWAVFCRALLNSDTAAHPEALRVLQERLNEMNPDRREGKWKPTLLALVVVISCCAFILTPRSPHRDRSPTELSAPLSSPPTPLLPGTPITQEKSESRDSGVHKSTASLTKATPSSGMAASTPVVTEGDKNLASASTPVASPIKSAELRQYEQAIAFYTQKKYVQATQEFQRYLDQFPSGPNVPSAVVRQADSHRQIGRTDLAKIGFEKFLASWPDSELCVLATYGLGSIHLAEKDPASALRQFQAAATRTKSPKNLLIIDYKIATCLEAIGGTQQFREAIALYKKLAEAAEPNPYKRDAQSALQRLSQKR